VTPGKFIALEGGEGAGKSTQARMLVEALRARGLDVVATREPGGTRGAETIRQLLLGLEGEDWNLRAEALLFAAARSDHVERLIRPALAAGKWVVCDRFLDSSRAYQGGGGGLSDEDILELHRIGSAGLLPDLTLLVEAAPEVAVQRLATLRAAIGSVDAKPPITRALRLLLYVSPKPNRSASFASTVAAIARIHMRRSCRRSSR
jgi:dTMP kinase